MGIGLLIALSLLIIFAFLYKLKYSMDKAESFEINDKTLSNKVLIATQGSDFKMNVTSLIIKGLESNDVYIKVIDVSELENEDETIWNSIVIMCTWEYNQPQEDASHFIDSATNPDKIIMVSTSGSGELLIRGIDGISSASNMEEVETTAEVVLSLIEEKLH